MPLSFLPIEITDVGKSSVQNQIKNTSTVDGDCWIWHRRKNQQGYGMVDYEGKSVTAHRLSYTAFIGPIPEGMTLDHLCKVRSCVNPFHLEPVTHQENIRRGNGISVQNAAKQFCINGHEFSGDNVRPKIVKGRVEGRYCLKCNRMRKRGEL